MSKPSFLESPEFKKAITAAAKMSALDQLKTVFEAGKKQGAIEAWQLLIKDMEEFEQSPREPGEKRADDFGSGGAAMEREMVKNYAKGKIKALKEAKDSE